MNIKSILFVISTALIFSCSTKIEKINTPEKLQLNPPKEKTVKYPNDNNIIDTIDTIELTNSIYFQMPDCDGACTKEDMNRLIENSQAEASIVRLINEAKSTIEFSMYTFSRKPIFFALLDASKRGVKIRGIVDHKQFRKTKSYCNNSGCTFDGIINSDQYLSSNIDERIELLKDLELFNKGSLTDKLAILLYKKIENSAMKPSSGKSKIMHNKFVLVDSSELYSGSGNWSYTAMSVNFENYTHYTKEDSEVVLNAFSCSFEALWNNDSTRISTALAECQNNDQVYFTPFNGPYKKSISSKIIHSINNSKKIIKISMHHLVHKGILSALEKALDRKIEVRVIFDDDDCNKEDLKISRLKMLGAKVRYMVTNCSLFQLAHNKYGIFDDTFTINGSANWSKAGLGKNYENFVVQTGASNESFLNHYNMQWDMAVEKSVCECDRSTPECQKHISEKMQI
jgi:phosphatidylserine/phosphatidylglycerophosphate/cardiolipin synthase-like enzyme